MVRPLNHLSAGGDYRKALQRVYSQTNVHNRAGHSGGKVQNWRLLNNGNIQSQIGLSPFHKFRVERVTKGKGISCLCYPLLVCTVRSSHCRQSTWLLCMSAFSIDCWRFEYLTVVQHVYRGLSIGKLHANLSYFKFQCGRETLPKMLRSYCLQCLLLCAVVCIVGAKPPNIVFIVADDLGENIVLF